MNKPTKAELYRTVEELEQRIALLMERIADLEKELSEYADEKE